MGALVYLVHGTFAPNACWARVDGAVAGILRNALPGAEVRTFTWSGANAHAARAEAGRQLAAEALTAARETGRSLYLIGHSHGGNVALHALKAPEVAEATKGLAFLGTPFLEVRFRSGWRMAKAFSSTLTFLLPLIVMLMGVLIGSILSVPISLEVPAMTLIFLSAAIAAAYGTRLRSRIGDWVWKKVMEGAREVEKNVVVPRPSCPVYVASVPLDEAGLLLNFWDRLTLLPWGAMSVLIRSFQSVVGGLVLAAMTGAFLPENTDTFGQVISTNVILPTALAILLAAPLTYAISLLRGSRFAFGGEGMSMVVAARVVPRAEPAWGGLEPFSVRESCRLPLGQERSDWRPWRRSLRHSFFYDDKDLVQRVADWIGMIERDAFETSNLCPLNFPAMREGADRSASLAFTVLPGAIVYALFLVLTL